MRFILFFSLIIAFGKSDRKYIGPDHLIAIKQKQMNTTEVLQKKIRNFREIDFMKFFVKLISRKFLTRFIEALGNETRMGRKWRMDKNA